MLYKTLSAAVYGIDANIIEVEVDVSGIKTMEDHFHTVGLPDAAVRESRNRVRAALKNCGYDIPPTHITINLAPADIRKEGSGFDLPMALGILGAYGGLNKKELPDCLFVGELSLDGGFAGFAARFRSRSKHAEGRSRDWSCQNLMPKKRRWSAEWKSIR
jgi:magnesium chelatase family protein